jgi:hypothetical protein
LPHPDLPEAPKATYANLELSIEPEQINLKGKAKYHWKGLLAQSMEFSLMENGFRLATDDTMRFQLAHKPFWHDYVAFIKQYTWAAGTTAKASCQLRWPSAAGSVGAFIEVQNSESQPRLQWNEPGYWRSRWLAFLWTTAYSTHWEISPLGEAGIGSSEASLTAHNAWSIATSRISIPETTIIPNVTRGGVKDLLYLPLNIGAKGRSTKIQCAFYSVSLLPLQDVS